jgi:[NiFe] hydrogenase assembly HybE family chaperone
MSMTWTPGFSADSPRIRELVERFREIGETSMRDLPLYNPDLEVESVGFRKFEDQWVGVLITPWFMNLLRLPKQTARMEMARIGRKVKAILPSGEHQLMQGGD